MYQSIQVLQEADAKMEIDVQETYGRNAKKNGGREGRCR